MTDPNQINTPDKYMTPTGANPLFLQLFPEAQLDIVRERLLKVARTNNDDNQFGTLKSYLNTFVPIQLIFISCLLDYLDTNPSFSLFLEYGDAMQNIFEDLAFKRFAAESGFGKKLNVYVSKVAKTDSVKTLIGSNAEHQLALYLLGVFSRIQPYVSFLKMDNDFSDDEEPVEQIEPEAVKTEVERLLEESEYQRKIESIYMDRMVKFIQYKYKQDGQRILAKIPLRGELPITVHNIHSVLSLVYKPYTMYTVFSESKSKFKIRIPGYDGTLELDETRFRLFILETLKKSFPDIQFLKSVVLNIEQ